MTNFFCLCNPAAAGEAILTSKGLTQGCFISTKSGVSSLACARESQSLITLSLTRLYLCEIETIILRIEVTMLVNRLIQRAL
jgi:hypothetical protein